MTERSRGYLAAADVLRVAAISLVGWYHIWQQSWLDPGFFVGQCYVNLQQVVRNGYLMVDVLLVLSGFLLALPYARARLGIASRPTVKQFYIKRFWRIVPAYALSVLLCLFLWALPQGQYASGEALAKDLITHFTFTHNLFRDVYFGSPILGVLWTMGVEVQFYALFPLIAAAYERRPWLTCLLLTTAALGVRLWVSTLPSTTFWVNQLPCMLDLYACGMAAALVYAKAAGKELRPRGQWLLALGALLALGILFQLLYKQTLGDGETVRRGQLLLRLPLGIASGAFLVCGCLAPPVLDRVFGNPVTRFFSAISYGFYMWHQFLAVRLKDWHIPSYAAELPNQAGEQPWQTRYTLLCFGAAILAGTALTYLWERPLARRALRRPEKASTAQ